MNTYCRVSLLVGLLSVAPICGFPRSVKAAPASRSAAAGDPSLYGRHPDESWTTPSLSGTRLKAQTPLVAQKDDRPTFMREMIPGGWRPFDSFQVYVIKPKGVVRPPVVLYLYDYNNDTARFMKDGYCERITRSGCAAIGFESALSASRFRMRPMRQWFVSELPESLSDSAHDVQMILNYLGTRGGLDMGRVGMFGHGSGAGIAILAAGADPRIRAIDLLNPWGDWPVWLRKSVVIRDADRPPLAQAGFAKAVAHSTR